ncbi:MAG: ABC transporter ATP-binding protein [Actinomycetota bacterium]
MGTEIRISARALTKRYGKRTVVDRLDLDVFSGEVFGLVGPNGAGKTTTILMLLGLTQPSGGTIRVAGLDPVRQPLDVKALVGYLPDTVGFYESLTGRQNLAYTARLNRLRRAEAEPRIDALLAEAGLSGVADDRVGTYSRGMRQRLGIADALVKDPAVLILDEPTVAIDPDGVAEILVLIRRLAEERGVTLLLSSHLLHQVQVICDRVGIFIEGRMVAQGKTDELVAGMELGPTVLEVGVDGDPGLVLATLHSVGGVTGVEPDQRVPRAWRVTAETDLSADVAAALVAAGLRLRSLRRIGEDLDSVYRRYFEEAR